MFSGKKSNSQKFLQRNFRDPKTVEKVGHEIRTSQDKNSWENFKIILDEGENGYAIATGYYEGKRVCGIRWNGYEEDIDDPSPLSSQRIGTPTSAPGHPSWFILPSFLASVVIDRAMDEQASWDWVTRSNETTRN